MRSRGTCQICSMSISFSIFHRCKCLLMFNGSHCQLTTQGFSGGYALTTSSVLPQEDMWFTLLWEDMPLPSLKKMCTLPSLKRICPLSSLSRIYPLSTLKRIYPLPSIGMVCPLPSTKRICPLPFQRRICLLSYFKRLCFLPFTGISMRRMWRKEKEALPECPSWRTVTGIICT